MEKNLNIWNKAVDGLMTGVSSTDHKSKIDKNGFECNHCKKFLVSKKRMHNHICAEYKEIVDKRYKELMLKKIKRDMTFELEWIDKTIERAINRYEQARVDFKNATTNNSYSSAISNYGETVCKAEVVAGIVIDVRDGILQIARDKFPDDNRNYMATFGAELEAYKQSIRNELADRPYEHNSTREISNVMECWRLQARSSIASYDGPLAELEHCAKRYLEHYKQTQDLEDDFNAPLGQP